MQIRISDIMDSCCPEGVELGTVDAALTQRVRENVMNKIKSGNARHRRRNLSRILLLAAVIATLMTVTAFGAELFTMNRSEVPEAQTISGYWRYVDEDGVVTDVQKLVYPDAGMVFSFTGPDVQQDYNLLEVKANWLPCEPDAFTTDEEGWSFYLTRQTELDDLPYIIEAYMAGTRGSRSVLCGKPVVVKEEDWDNWHVLEITTDYTGTDWARDWPQANYILMFDENTGWLVRIGGTGALTVLEKIAQNLEVRESNTPNTLDKGLDRENCVDMLDIGRG